MATKTSLPLLSAPPTVWEGLTLAGPLEQSFTPAEPLAPQGAYNSMEPEAPLAIPPVEANSAVGVAELLAPAGGLDAAFAAFHYGADAIYLGLKKFSARAEAENFTLEEVDQITAYAHSFTPRRRVFVTINTLIRQDELPELIEALAALEDLGVDAVILQDLGVYLAIRRHFPKLALHGSTQMAVHNRAGAEVLHRLGFERVVLARELTFEEVGEITRGEKPPLTPPSQGGEPLFLPPLQREEPNALPPLRRGEQQFLPPLRRGGRGGWIETEVFIHGALCYAYSGLCLFSAQTLGRSGNRGKCAYSCRDSYEVTGAPLTLRDGAEVKRDPTTGFPFSMKDLALPDHLPALRAAGVACFKIEGRKKSPLYVATTTDYYRKLLDGRLDPNERPDIEADLQTVFSRPWTRLFVQSHKDKEVADRDTVGHRGTLIGKVDRVIKGNESKLRFVTRRPLERHDGLQIDLPILGKPFGFAVDHLWIVGRGKEQKSKEVFSASADSLVEVGLPVDHPMIPSGAPVYCSSSQAVKQKYRHERPKPGLFHVRKSLHIEAVLGETGLTVTATCDDAESVEHLTGPFPPCHDSAAMEASLRNAFARLGNSPFELAGLTFTNKAGAFIPVSRLNERRRNMLAKLHKNLQAAHAARLTDLQKQLSPKPRHEYSNAAGNPRWSIKVDRVSFLDDFEKEDWHDVDELIVDITRDHLAALQERLSSLAQQIGPERIRLALPALTRRWEEKPLLQKIDALRQAGWKKWEAANLSAWTYLGLDPASGRTDELDLATDWSVYVLNRLAALQLCDMGVSRFALSPEDGLANWASLWSEFGPRAVLIVYQDTPLFVAESCAYANLIGGCPGKANCNFQSMEMVSSHGEKVTALDYHCRTIVLNQGPFCLSTRLAELRRAGAMSLRADFIYRDYDPATVRERWRLVRAGRPVPGGHAANMDRGIL